MDPLFNCLLWIIKSVNHINSLPNNKILDVIKLKAFAHDKLNIDRMMISLFDSEENTVGKGELIVKKTLWEKEKMLVPSIFSFFHSVFQSLLL